MIFELEFNTSGIMSQFVNRKQFKDYEHLKWGHSKYLK